MREMTHLHLEEFLSIMDRLPFFASFSEAQRRVMAERDARVCSYDTGEFLIQQGGADRGLIFLLYGAASVVQEGQSIPLAEVKPGGYFGEVAFLTPRNRTSNVIAHPPSAHEPGYQSLLPEEIEGSILRTVADHGEHATTIALLFDQPVLERMDRPARVLLKREIINTLAERVDRLNDEVAELTGVDPMLTIDEELEALMRRGAELSLDRREQIQDQIIEHLIEFQVELNSKTIDTF